jgi:DNA-binding transcriptional MocR family regulator
MGTVAAQQPDVISFAAGYPAADLFPLDELRDVAASLLGGDGEALQYGPTKGHLPLVEALVAEMARRSVTAVPEELLVTTGSQQGLDLAARVLTGPGDTVLVELPTFTGAISAFRNAQAHVTGVRQGPDGIDLDDLERITATLAREGRRVKLLYVVPNFQNPTGRLLSMTHRQALLEWAARHDTLIVEDDPYGALFFEGEVEPGATRPLKSLDADGRVVYLSSFSKTLAPGFRVGWMVAVPPLVERFEIAKQGADLTSGTLDQRFACEALRRGVIDRLVPRLRRTYRSRRDAMVAALRAQLPGRLAFDTPRGGFFLWATLAEGERDTSLLDRALEERLIFVSGSAFFVDGGGHDTIRLAFSAAPDALIGEGVARLGRALAKGRRPEARDSTAGVRA